MIAGNNNHLQTGILPRHLTQKQVKQALRLCPGIGTVENIARHKQHIRPQPAYLQTQPVQETNMLRRPVVIKKSLSQMPIGRMNDSHEDF
jgi:hypothetical protein